MTGAITSEDITKISDAMRFSSGNVSLDLSGTSGLTSIGNSAFDGCTSLTSITIPEGVTSISVILKNEKIVILEQLKNKIGNNAVLAFVDGNYEYEVKKSVDYLRAIISLEIQLTSDCMLSFTCNRKDSYEIGLRKACNKPTVNERFYLDNQVFLDSFAEQFKLMRYNKDWLYFYSNDVSIDNAVEKLKKMFNCINGKIREAVK